MRIRREKKMWEVDIPPNPHKSSTVHVEVAGLAVLFMPENRHQKLYIVKKIKTDSLATWMAGLVRQISCKVGIVLQD